MDCVGDILQKLHISNDYNLMWY